MIRGLYSAASGMVTQAARMDAVTNNLANATTDGYKRETVVAESFPDMLLYRIGQGQDPAVIGSTTLGVLVGGVSTDFSPGLLKQTGRATDIALTGPGFFTVQPPGGGTMYTRAGDFQIDGNGYLVTPDGARVLGQKGPIRFDLSGGQPPEIRIDARGQVSQRVSNSGQGTWQPLDTLFITDFKNPAALRLAGAGYTGTGRAAGTGGAAGAAGGFTGAGYFTDGGQAGAVTVTQPRVQQGFLEKSNVNLVDEVAALLEVYRSYEADQRVAQAQDQLLGKAVNEVGLVR